MKHRIFGILPVAGLAASAAAQSTTAGSQVTLALHWQDTGNNNGVLEPGESALLSIDASFTNQNTVATVTPLLGTFGSGTIRGLGSGFIDLDGTAGAQGDWVLDPALGYGVASEWDVTGGKGNGSSANAGASLQNIQFGQFAPTPAAIMTANPIPSIWRGVWTPSLYSVRTVTIAIHRAVAGEGPPTSLVFELSPTTPAGIFVRTSNNFFGSALIPIVPAPGSSVLLALAVFAQPRSRRTFR